LVLFFGGLHKILSPVFLNGDFLNFLFVKGQLGGHILKKIEVFHAYFYHNYTTVSAFSNHLDSEAAQLTIPFLFQYQDKLILYFTYFVIIFEFLLVFVVWFKNIKIKNILLIFFLISVLCTRLETGFVSILCLLCLAQLPSKTLNYKALYISIFTVCILLIVFKIGLH
jgi:hypothetical protein